MKIPFYQSKTLTAINVEIEPKTIHIGILILEPLAEEVQIIGNTKFHLLDELIKQYGIKVALETNFELFKED